MTKIDAIKLVRAKTSISLKEAKELVEQLVMNSYWDGNPAGALWFPQQPSRKYDRREFAKAALGSYRLADMDWPPDKHKVAKSCWEIADAMVAHENE